MKYHFSWFQLAEPLIHAIEHAGATHDDAIRIVTSWAICIGLLLFAVVARAGLKVVQNKGGTAQFIPGTGLGITALFELYTGAILGMLDGVLSKEDAKRYYWLLGGTFLYIFISNLMSVVPGGLPPTDNISTNAAMALVVLGVYVFEGVRRTGMHFFKHMMGPVLPLAPLIFAIEAAGVFIIRPASLTLRLFGNINGDHMVFTEMLNLVPLFVPAIFLGLGIWVSFLQAFVFTLLSAIYLLLSVDHGDDDGHH
ncbi:MAG: ATP synthase F0 subunit A [Deltaproteobacteria bacterium]|nr:ATP synthase F0 subunit A [Deltaproteobacteria bacterium]HCH61653.1 ATP synthase F0 subunit A [Deltaproteobacteria bacterium]|tara:strand:- start:36 stop:794 length:759 start_codon:yes stop_codon:yes gene_type:complete